jgi:hypothetical protein
MLRMWLVGGLAMAAVLVWSYGLRTTLALAALASAVALFGAGIVFVRDRIRRWTCAEDNGREGRQTDSVVDSQSDRAA